MEGDSRDTIRRAGGDNDSDICLFFALVVLEFFNPLCGPCLGSLGFPDDFAALAALASAHAVDDVCSELAFFDFNDFVVREGLGERVFDFEFQSFSLGLHRALLGALLEFGDFFLELANDVVLVGGGEAFLLGSLSAGLISDFPAFLGKCALDFECEVFLSFLEFGFFAEQVEFSFLGSLQGAGLFRQAGIEFGQFQTGFFFFFLGRSLRDF